MQRTHLSQKYRFGSRDVLDGLARHRVREKADEITGMSRFECHADLAVGLEAADAGTVPGTRIDDDERPARRIDFDTRRRNDSHEAIIDRAIERSAVEH